jgi:hypothetical protein
LRRFCTRKPQNTVLTNKLYTIYLVKSQRFLNVHGSITLPRPERAATVRPALAGEQLDVYLNPFSNAFPVNLEIGVGFAVY